MSHSQGVPVSTGKVETNGVSIAYERFGEPGAPAVLMIAGLAQQRISWPERLCRGLARAGYQVIRYDNREVGESTWTEARLPKNVLKYIAMSKLGVPIGVGPGQPAQYDLNTMALDGVGLLDALDIEHAHFVGFSMGGMICQLAALNHPERRVSLTSIMSSTNDRDLPMPTFGALGALVSKPRGTSHDELAEEFAKSWRVISSPAHPTPHHVRVQRGLDALSRGYNPVAGGHHLMAILATGGFGDRLRQVNKPTLVIHGNADPLVRVAGGKRTASRIPGAKLQVIPGMGHDFPDQLMPAMTCDIRTHIEAADNARPTGMPNARPSRETRMQTEFSA